jgi:hypothetical protein
MVRGLATVAPYLQMPPRGSDRVRKVWGKSPPCRPASDAEAEGAKGSASSEVCLHFCPPSFS